ncbi:hypothetical protein EOD39_12682 [Acipenser ruthenus]|uniref:Uncharacterized protein n=1 Tax=Acipenser ruthenus TaxID=7906 RepID=A0A662YS41_ACIRT|nr:hypothetical protein EOD39_12682 [Acipenser ruthenus]
MEQTAECFGAVSRRGGEGESMRAALEEMRKREKGRRGNSREARGETQDGRSAQQQHGGYIGREGKELGAEVRPS